jgi:hypothetical protein
MTFSRHGDATSDISQRAPRGVAAAAKRHAVRKSGSGLVVGYLRLRPAPAGATRRRRTAEPATTTIAVYSRDANRNPVTTPVRLNGLKKYPGSTPSITARNTRSPGR